MSKLMGTSSAGERHEMRQCAIVIGSMLLVAISTFALIALIVGLEPKKDQ